jgi:hypothetical protein
MNGDNEKLWIEINAIKLDIAEIKVILKGIPDKINLALGIHQDDCKACSMVIEHDKRLDKLETKQAEGEKKSTFWRDKGVGVILAIMQAITVAFLVVKLGLK